MGAGASLAPVGLAVASAFMFGVSGILAKRGLRHVDPHTGALLTIGTAMGAFALGAPLWMRSADWFTAGFWVFVLNGLMHPMLSMYMALEAMTRTGPTVAATFASTAPLFAALTAVVFLGESVNAIIVAGTLAAMGGVIVLSWSGGGVSTLTRIALAFATGAALVRGLNHTVGKWGLDLLPNVFMAGFVSFAVSFIGSLVVYRLRRGALPRGIAPAGLHLFVGSGALIAGAIACMYSALALGRVVVVSPIIAVYPLFTLLSGLVLGDERLSRRLAVGVALALGGVALVSVGAGR